MTGPGPAVFGGGSSDVSTMVCPDRATPGTLPPTQDPADTTRLALDVTAVHIAYRAALQTADTIRQVSLLDFLR